MDQQTPSLAGKANKKPWYKRPGALIGRTLLAILGLIFVFFIAQVYQYTEGYRLGTIDTEGFTALNELPDTYTPLSREELETTSDPWFGNPDAEVVVVEFGDFECPFCKQSFPIIRKLQHEFEDNILFIWRDFPLVDIHPRAAVAAEAGECAHEQGKFWEYHDKLFINQHALAPQDLKRYAAELGMNTNKFNLCLDSGKYEDEVQHDFDTALDAGAIGTPTLFINGEIISGVLPEHTFRAILEELVK